MNLSLSRKLDLEAGSVFAGRYRLERELGRGGMGVVFAAQDLERDLPVAVKLLVASPDAREGSDAVARRFRREFRAVQRLSHPNVVAVYDSGTVEGQAYFTMEIVQGQNLRSALDLSPGRPDPDLLSHPRRLRGLMDLFRQLCQALVAIHANRIIHRDLKPSNILLTPAGQIKVMDFGLVRAIDEDASRLTQEGILVGTVAYMSPEQALGGRMDFRSDLYSVGVILYEALAGRRPFLDPSVTGLLLKQVHERPHPVSVYNPKVPPPLEAIARRLLEKDPFARFQSSEELLRALESAAQLLDRSEDHAGPGLSPGPSAGLPSSHALLPPRFIGRENELQRLRARIEALSSGQGSVALVAGESGIGKSRLLEEIRGLGRLHQIQFLRGKCFEGSVAPYGAFLAPLERLAEGLARRGVAEQRAALGHECRALTQISPAFLGLPAVAELPPLESLPPAQERYRVFSAVTTLLRRLASRRPMAIILEDLQWADALSMDLLGHLVRNLVHPAQELDAPDLAAPVLLLGAYREDEIQAHPLKPLLAQLRRRHQLEHLVLGRLDLEQVAAFLQSMLAMDEPPRNLARRIFQESEGNPFFVEEIMKSLLEEGILKRDQQGWVLDYEVSPDSAALETGSLYAHLKIPASIQDVVNKRLERLAPEEQKILACAAVIGREFSFDLLLEVAQLQEDELLDTIDSFLKNQVISERPSARDSFDFYHAKIREVLYDGLRPRERVRHHRNIALAAERLYAGSLEQHYEFLAHHCFAAGLQDQAIEYLYKAGRRLQERYLNDEAISHFRRAIAILDAKAPGLTQEQILTKLSCFHALGQVLLHTGEIQSALEVYDAMEALARAERLEIQMAWALLDRGQCEMRLGNYPRATELLLTAQSVFSRHQEIPGLASSHKILAGVETFQHHFVEAGRQNERALALFQQLGSKQELAAVLGDIGVNHHHQKQLDEALTAYTRSLELSRDLGDRGGMARILTNLGVACLDRSQYQRALDYYGESLRLHKEVGNKPNIAICYQNQSHVFIDLGHYDQALSTCARAVELSEELGQRYYLCQALINRGEVLLALGDHPGARQSLDKALQLSQQIDVPSHVAYALLNLACLEQRESRLDQALALYKRCQAEGERGGIDLPLSRARLRQATLEMPAGGWSTGIILDLVARVREIGSQVDGIHGCLDAADLFGRIDQFEPAEALALEAWHRSRDSGLLDLQRTALDLLGRIRERQGDPLLAAEHHAEALGVLEEILDHVPQAYHDRFLGRSDIAASLAAARRLAEQTASPRLLSALAAFPARSPLADLTRTVALSEELASSWPGSAESEVTGAVDYEKLGVLRRQPQS